MKKILVIIMALSLFACQKKSDNPYVTLQGTIKNAGMDSITILGKQFKKVIPLKENGSFKDTLKVVDGFHGLTDGNQQAFLYLKNGYDLVLDIDMAEFPEGVSFKGQGSTTNNYMADKLIFIQNEKLTDYGHFFQMQQEEFNVKIEEVKKNLDLLLTEAEGLDPAVYKTELEMNEKLIMFFQSNYEKEHQKYIGLNAGDPSPTFTFQDQFGKEVSLSDLKGKYVYIDVWATWCAPCKKEIPFLKEMDETYKNKNIEFVSVSIDKLEHKDKWLKMIEEEELRGIQLLADNDWNSEFVSAYNIQGIPRFILIDQQGNIVNSNAPRPSDPSLKDLLNTLEL